MSIFKFIKSLEFDRKVKFVEILFLVLGVLLVLIQLRESNRINWLQNLEIRSNDLIKIQIENESLQCLYQFNNLDLKEHCADAFNDFKEQKKAIVYLDELLDLYIEIIDYDLDYSIYLISEENEFNEYYKKWYKEIFYNKIVRKKFEKDLDKDKIEYIENYIIKTN